MLETASGLITYDPRLPDRFDPWWVIVGCYESLGAQLRERLLLQQGVVLEPPPWGTHISVVSGEEPPGGMWALRDGELVTFQYAAEPRRHGQFWWVDVDCPELLDLREALGLPREPRHPLHLTLGRAQTSPKVTARRF